MVFPITSLPKPKPFHLFPIITEGGISVHSAMQIHFYELFKISSNYLIRIDKDDFVQRKWEKHIQEKDLVSPDGSLFLSLLTEPVRPFI